MLSSWKVPSVILTMAEDMIKCSSLSEAYWAVMNSFPRFNPRYFNSSPSTEAWKESIKKYTFKAQCLAKGGALGWIAHVSKPEELNLLKITLWTLILGGLSKLILGTVKLCWNTQMSWPSWLNKSTPKCWVRGTSLWPHSFLFLLSQLLFTARIAGLLFQTKISKVNRPRNRPGEFAF